MTSKQTILFWTDVALLALFAALAATGGVMHWVLPPGSGGRPGGHPARKELLDLSRHDWGQIHFWIAAAMVALIVVHLALHWGWIKTCSSRVFTHARTSPYAKIAESTKIAEKTEPRLNLHSSSLPSLRSLRSGIRF